MVFELESDARRVEAVLAKRFGKYGLELHPEKTRLIDFRRSGGSERGQTFDLLGFTHYWGKSRKGGWTVKRKTSKNRLRKAIKRVSEWCQRNRHAEVREQHDRLSRVIKGHCGYYGITGNYRALAQFVEAVTRIWQKWLNRRSGKVSMPWSRFKELLGRWPLPAPRVVHSMVR